MTVRTANAFKVALRVAQACVVATVAIDAYVVGWWTLLMLPVAVVVLWAWQVLYENLP